MNIFKKVWCRIYQTAFRLALPFLPYREPQIFYDCKEACLKLKQLGIKRAIIVTDEAVYKCKLTKQFENALNENAINYVVFDSVRANPTVKNVEKAKSVYLKERCQAIIAIGGGSSIDCAKALGALIAYPDKSLNQLKGLLKVLKRIPPLVAVPTTAGTGSEVTLTAVITDSDKKHKYTMNDFTLIPRYAVLDATLTYSLPKALTATTGMDALTHAVEAFIGRSTTKETREKSLQAVELIFSNVKRAYDDGNDKQARENMLKASYLAGVAFSRSYVGYVHSVAHSLGGRYNVPHGLANAVLLPIVLKEYGKTVYKKLHILGIRAGVCEDSDSPEEAAKKFIGAIIVLNEYMGIPERLSGINERDVKDMAKHADKEANPLYPVPCLMDAKQLEKFYYQISEKV
ncbi:MAG: iron-containing alcohol dehydrogenase [Christensenellaceae bacterium]